MDWRDSELENDDLKNYKAKAEFYVRQHQDNAAIAKLRSNVPLTEADVRALEAILWSEIGTKQEYEAEYGEKPWANSCGRSWAWIWPPPRRRLRSI